MELRFVWTHGNDEVFRSFYEVTEAYYSRIAGGEQNRKGFIPHNLSSSVDEVLLVYDGETPAACSGIKRYSETEAEIKRVWVEPAYRREHIAARMMAMLEERAKALGYRRTILQTREIMKEAVGLYTRSGYHRIDNYPPYDRLEGAICFTKELQD